MTPHEGSRARDHGTRKVHPSSTTIGSLTTPSFPPCVSDLKIFEDIMVDFIKAKGATIYEFYEACTKKKGTGSAQEKHFIELLTASAAYKDFQEIMCREAKQRMFQQKHIREGRIDPETLKRIDEDDKGGYRAPSGGIGGDGAAAKSFNHK